MQQLVFFIKPLNCKVLTTSKTFKQLHDAKSLRDAKYYLSYTILQAAPETKLMSC